MIWSFELSSFMFNNKKLYEPFKCLSCFDLSSPNCYLSYNLGHKLVKLPVFLKNINYLQSLSNILTRIEDCLNLLFDRRNWIFTKKISKNVLISNLSLVMTWHKIIIKCHGILFSGIEKKTLLTFIKGRLSGWFFQKQINKTNVCNWSMQENGNTPTML